ncbi:DUF2510 domain-containing protein [Leifsonia sp. NPDC058230]|uniref:DUF2510 domain-containing protein n=1 Tax=Leifsonia sp. NPDC058230 TaxID=3346391 RepID=UPI0036D87D21
MSNTNGQTPAGWYTDPSGSQQLRWWDGVRWTENYLPAAQPAAPVQPTAPAQQTYVQPGYGQPAYGAAPAVPYAGASFAPERRQLAPGARIYNVWIWLVVALPILPSLLLPFWNPFTGMASIRTERDLQNFSYQFGIFNWAYFTIIIVSWLSYGLMVVFAWLDYRELKRTGVDRPFHWAWAFLSSFVYVIGRSVIVRRVASGRGLAPIWVSIGIVVASFVIGIAWISLAFDTLYRFAPGYTGGFAA